MLAGMQAKPWCLIGDLIGNHLTSRATLQLRIANPLQEVE
jgi:hypothetical protein